MAGNSRGGNDVIVARDCGGGNAVMEGVGPTVANTPSPVWDNFKSVLTLLLPLPGLLLPLPGLLLPLPGLSSYLYPVYPRTSVY